MSYKNRSRIFAKAVKGFAALGLAALIVAGLVGCAQQDADPDSPQLADIVDEEGNLDIAKCDKANKDFIASYSDGLRSNDVDTPSEYDSLKFYDIYITNDLVNKEANQGDALVVRYTAQLDGNEHLSLFTRTYKMDEMLYFTYKQSYNNYADVGSFLTYLYEHKDTFENRYNFMASIMDDYEDSLSDGSLTHFTAADFEEYINSLSDPENADTVND